MASNYPGSADSFDTIAADKKQSDTVGGRTHRTMHNDLGDAIEAVQTELGANPSGSESTVVARLEKIEDGTRLGTGSVTSTHILNGTIVDADINAAAAIDSSKLVFGAAKHLSGTGAPEGAVTAPPGSTFLQTDSTTDVKGWIRWIKATGTGNTGWVAGPEADTGWRDVTADLANGWTAASGGHLRVRRIGSRVTLRTRALKWPSTTLNSANALYAAPAGFIGGQGGDWGTAVGTVYAHPGYGGQSLGPVFAYPDGRIALQTTAYATSDDDGANLWTEISFFTDNAWPTSLPGSAV